MTKTTKKAARRPSREGTKPAARPKKAPVEDGLSREQIEQANAAGPGAVASLIRGAKGSKAKDAAKASEPKTTAAPKKAAPVERDPRLPAVGTTLIREFNGKEIKAEVLDAGFRYDGKTWRSLSAIAKSVTGTSWNGFLFFNLQTRASKPGKAAPASKAEAK